MRIGLTALYLALSAVAASGTAHAATRKQERSVQDGFTPAEAVKGQAWLDTAMSTPMLDLLQKADVTNPEAMLEYGLGLELGRPSASGSLSEDAKAKLKADYRLMLDLYLNGSDKKDPVLSAVNFNEDAMLDNQEFWVDLAKQIGHRKERTALDQTIPDSAGMGPGAPMMAFIPDPQDDDNGLNLSKDLVLPRGVVNAAVACAESAAGFAKMKKAQTVDGAELKLDADKLAAMRTDAVRVYRTSYAVGIQACGSRDYFMKAADFATANLGAYGSLKDDPAATVAEVGQATTDDAADAAAPAKN